VPTPTIKQIRAYTLAAVEPTITIRTTPLDDDHIAPMSKYRNSRKPSELRHQCPGTLVVEVEASDGAWALASLRAVRLRYIVENTLRVSSRPCRHGSGTNVGSDVPRLAVLRSQGVVVNALSGVDLALWDLLGKVRGDRCISCSRPRAQRTAVLCDGSRPDLAKQMGFIAARCRCATAREGEEGLRRISMSCVLCASVSEQTSGHVGLLDES